MKRFIKVLCVVSVLIYFTVGASSFAQEIDITEEEKAEQIETIKDAVDTYGEQLILRIPGLMVKKDPEGNIQLHLKKADKAYKIEELSDEEFVDLYRTISTQVTIMMTERINEQQRMLQQMQQNLNIIRQQQILQQTQQIRRPPQPPPAPPQPPHIYIPPSTQVPAGPPNIPNIPSGPPPGPPAHR